LKSAHHDLTRDLCTTLQFLSFSPARINKVLRIHHIDCQKIVQKKPILAKPELCKGLALASAARRIAFSQFRPGIEKAKANPENPVNPV
jgi:hypothetical protein